MWFHEFFRFGFYKRNQGRIARQATFGALAVIVVVGCWRLSQYYNDQEAALHIFTPLVLLVIGLWASFRAVQMPAFADFLISVEGEMNKVSWPARGVIDEAVNAISSGKANVVAGKWIDQLTAMPQTISGCWQCDRRSRHSVQVPLVASTISK